MNIQLLSELTKTSLKPLYYFKLPENTGDKSLNIFKRNRTIDWQVTGGATMGEYWEYDTVGWSQFSGIKKEEHKYFTTVTKYKSFMKRIKTWEDSQYLKAKKLNAKGYSWEF
jgi:hypothetical protein